jgi:hypothetical protein
LSLLGQRAFANLEELAVNNRDQILVCSMISLARHSAKFRRRELRAPMASNLR